MEGINLNMYFSFFILCIMYIYVIHESASRKFVSLDINYTLNMMCIKYHALNEKDAFKLIWTLLTYN